MKDEPNDQPALIGVSIEELLLTGRSHGVISTDIADQVGKLLQQVKMDLDLRQKIATLEAEKAELVEALTHAEAILSNAPEFSTTNSGHGPETCTSHARAMARALLSKHKGGE